MSGFVELLKKRFADTLEGDALTFLDYVSSGAARMSGLIADLLSYSRELDDTYEFQELPLNDGVDIAKQNLSGLVESTGARIERANLPVVNANRTRMVQLFQNLLGNAVKYRSEQPPRNSDLGGASRQILDYLGSRQRNRHQRGRSRKNFRIIQTLSILRSGVGLRCRSLHLSGYCSASWRQNLGRSRSSWWFHVSIHHPRHPEIARCIAARSCIMPSRLTQSQRLLL